MWKCVKIFILTNHYYILFGYNLIKKYYITVLKFITYSFKKM